MTDLNKRLLDASLASDVGHLIAAVRDVLHLCDKVRTQDDPRVFADDVERVIAEALEVRRG